MASPENSGPTDSLFPRPRSVRWGDGVVSADTEVIEVEFASLPEQGYDLSASPGGVELRYSDAAGLRYGRQTLEQLTGPEGVRCADIRDWPDIAQRGFMLDISRDRVPTRETLELLVQRLAAARYNQLQLYTEHTFAYTGHDVVWADASPMTADDMAWLDSRCADHDIELIANQNTFGHMERWLRHDDYRHRAETPDGFEMMGVRRGPSALAPTADNAEFALGLVRELLGTVSSSRVNIGCDEVWELGKGASAAEVAEHGKVRVFVDHLHRLAMPLLAEGNDVQFWADMVESDISVGAELAEAGAIAAIWGYSAPLDIDPETMDLSGLDESVREIAEEYLRAASQGFSPRLEKFAASGFRTLVAGGTSGWNSFVGLFANARANMADAVTSATAHGAEGVLFTEWGDNGHHQSPFATLPIVGFGGAAAWCWATNGELKASALASWASDLLGDPTGALGQAMVELNQVADTLGGTQFNGAAFFYAAVRSNLPMSLDAPEPERVAAARAQLRRVRELLATAQPSVVDATLLVAEAALGADLVEHGIDVLEASTAGDGAEKPRATAELQERYRAAWLNRSRPGGLEDSVARLT
jgi:hypothetical protein